MIPGEQGWRRTLVEHPRRWCPRCKKRHCPEWAYACEQLIVNGLPLTDDRSHETTGEARRTA